MKSGSPSRTTAAHETQTKIPGLVLSPDHLGQDGAQPPVRRVCL